MKKKIEINSIDDYCDCGEVLIKKQNMFYLGEFGMMPGLVCEKCNALYNSEEFLQALKKRMKVAGAEKE